VIELLRRERGRLETLARALLERETLEQPEAYELAGVELPQPDTEEADAQARHATPEPASGSPQGPSG
jgi:hypothetical protein